MPAGNNYIDIPCTIEYGTQKTSGLVLQLNTTGMMVELPNLPYRAGAVVTAHIQLSAEDILVQEMRAIKSYDNFFRKKPDPKQAEPPVPQKLSELHFTKLDEVVRQRIIRFLGRWQALQRQGK